MLEAKTSQPLSKSRVHDDHDDHLKKGRWLSPAHTQPATRAVWACKYILGYAHQLLVLTFRQALYWLARRSTLEEVELLGQGYLDEGVPNQETWCVRTEH